MTTRYRAPAILLLLALLGGGIGLPLFDALVFHSDLGAKPSCERVLWDGDSARNHVQVCQLNHAVPTEQSLGGQAVRAPSVLWVASAPRFSFQPVSVPAPVSSSQLSRAPPSV